MFLTVLIESHAEPSRCMQIHTLLSSISSEGCVWKRRAGVLAHELGDRFVFNVLTAILSATVFGAGIQYTCTVPSHTQICQLINYSCPLLTVRDSWKAQEPQSACLVMHPSGHLCYQSIGFLFNIWLNLTIFALFVFKDTASDWVMNWPLTTPQEERVSQNQSKGR